MNQITLLAACALCAAPAIAQQYAYDFSGDLDSHFERGADADWMYSFQSGGELQIDSAGTGLGGVHTESFVHVAARPRVDQSFNVWVDVGVPFETDTAFNPILQEQYALAGLAITLDDPNGLPRRALIGLELYSGPYEFNIDLDRRYRTLIQFDGAVRYDGRAPAVTHSSGRVGFMWDAEQLELRIEDGRGFSIIDFTSSRYSGLFQTPDQTFSIEVLSEISNHGVFETHPLTHDNFEAELFSPPCTLDLTGDGVLDLGDVQAFVSLFLSADLAADFNPDGVLDNADIQTFVSAYLAGC